ncbi:MAG: isoleucine--tRNA ligase [Anaerolineae bacterium]|nr:isoleucine--tRNA ligase [Anaerolineae bacterium]
MVFEPVSSRVNVNDVEKAQLDFWHRADVFQRTMREREGGTPYVFYEGPPTANGRPGTHHVEARAFKDMFPRYKTMRGYYVLRKGGWDTHGLPVEIEVEKELGFQHKHQIEEYGIAEFNAKCRQSVLRYIREWEELTERMGYWVDLNQAYFTFTNDYVQSVWWILRQFWDQDLLFQGYKVVPYCPRCGTPLSSHEVNLGYKDNTPDPSFYVRFKVRDEADTFFLVWTTTPWTLPGNVALAVGEKIDYVKIKGQNARGETEYLICAESLLHASGAETAKHSADEGESKDDARPRVLEILKNYTVVEQMKGAALKGRHYEPLFSYLSTDRDHAYVITGDFVSTDDGTGIVHIAPAFGADDMEAGKANDLPTLLTVSEEGTFIPEVTDFAGMWVKDADAAIVRNMDERGLVFAYGRYYHTYPFCWRCDTPLLYYARPTWYIRTSSRRDDLVGLNKTINWVPEHIRDGRFGNWLEGNIDWALGRERYWGTPLPVWQCDGCGQQHCIGGVAELSEKTGRDLSELDLHRPYVDEVTWACTCGGTMRRVPELIDVWFDSGARPFAQWGYPYYNQEKWAQQYPADYICEAVDQTRGWFYSLHAISALLRKSVAFRNVISLGHILDEKGQKMSKSKGNVVQPWDVFDTYGADVFRWYMYTASPPGEPRRFSINLVGQSYRSFWTTLWNTYSFFVTYANLDGFNPLVVSIPLSERTPLDRWVLSELQVLVRTVTDALENYDATNATRPIEKFVEDLSNWYVRRSRRRFWRSDDSADKAAAYLTLYECLVTVSKLLAPAMPFVSEAIYRNLVASIDPTAPDSVHLSPWPEVDAAQIDEQVMEDMRLVMRLVSLGLAARNSAGVKVRQPLAAVAFSLPAERAGLLDRYGDIIAGELNVKVVSVLGDAADVVAYSLNTLPQAMGRKYGKDFPVIQKLLREHSNPAEYARALLAGKTISVPYNGTEAVLSAEEVEVRRSPLAGYTVAEDPQYLAALHVALTDDLVAEGLASDFIRRVQVLRREADFKVDDRIVTTYHASEKLARAVEQFAGLIRDETLSLELQASASPDGEKVEQYDIEGESLTLGVRRIR